MARSRELEFWQANTRGVASDSIAVDDPSMIDPQIADVEGAGAIRSGVVSDIQRCSVHDGPGIRTTVFLKGCPLVCPWCHNPESQRGDPEILFDEERCIHCEACRRACPKGAIDLGSSSRVDRGGCDGCGLCAAACPALALVLCGRRMSVRDVADVVERDRPFYEASGGGVTLSGGEPAVQPEFAAALLAECRARSIPTAIQTAGWCSPDALERMLRHTDLVLFDLKTVDPDVHQRVLGKPLAPVITSARLVAQSGCPLLVRIPVVPGFNDDKASLESLLEFAAHLTDQVAFIAYHRLATGKYRRLGREYPMARMAEPAPERFRGAAALAAAKGLRVRT
jgi:pyruvate formate lyase activating enzyme